MANREQRSNREKRKPKADKPRPPVAQTPPFARPFGAAAKSSGGKKKLNPSRVRMANHKFKVGQSVDYNPGRSGMPASSWQYKILQLLPAEGSDLLYRIKSSGETFERVAKERELAPR